MSNQTQENIKRKRRIRKRRRRLRMLRFLVFLCFLSIVGWCGYHIYLWGSRTYDTYYEIYQGYQQRQNLKRENMDPRFDGYTNILILGIDDGNEIGQRADTVLLMSLDNTSGDVRFLSIPRDTLVAIPGRRQPETINNAYYYGGAALTQQTVSALLGVTVHDYITLDTKALAEVIDTLGGIDLYIEGDMDYEDPEADLSIHFKKGYQHLNGDEVQKYLRYRSGELGDIGRVQRQQRFLKALYARILQVDTVAKLPALLDIFEHRISTSAELLDTARIAGALERLNGSTPKTLMLPGAPQAGNDNVWMPSSEGINEKMEELFPTSREN